MKKLSLGFARSATLLAVTLSALNVAQADAAGNWDKLSTVLSAGAPLVAGFNSWRKGDDEGEARHRQIQHRHAETGLDRRILEREQKLPMPEAGHHTNWLRSP